MAKTKPFRGFYPNSFHTHLLKEIPKLGCEEPDDQRALLHMAWCFQAGRFEHASLGHEGYNFITHQALAQFFNRGRRRGRFPQINRRVEMFEVLNWDRRQGEARAYRPTPALVEAYLSHSKEFPAGDIPADLIDQDGKVIRKFRSGILSKDARGRTAKTTTKINPYCPVNVRGLNNAKMLMTVVRDQVLQGKRNRFVTEQLNLFGYDGAQHRDLRTWIDHRLINTTQLIGLSNTSACPSGAIPSGYVEHRSGRLYPATYPHLQNVPRELRKIALAGCWEYDFANCHYALFLQLCKPAGFHPKAIQHYLDNKLWVREKIASDVGLTIDQVKEALIALIYGASTRKGVSHPFYSRNALLEIVGHDEQKHGALCSNALFLGLAGDIVRGRDPVIEKAPKSRGGVQNVMGKFIDRSKRKSQILSHLLQGAEALCLNTILRHHADQIILLQHDGWNTPGRLNVSAMELWIEKETGFEMAIEEKLLPADGLWERWQRWAKDEPELLAV